MLCWEPLTALTPNPKHDLYNNNLTCKAPVCAKRKTSVVLADRTSRWS